MSGTQGSSGAKAPLYTEILSPDIAAEHMRVVDRFRIDGGTALVVGGGGGGIGTESASALAEAGADVIVFDLSEELLAPTVALASAAGRSVESHVVDMLDRKALVEKLDVVLKRDVHILVNALGGAGRPAAILDYPDEQFDEVVNRNLGYVFFASRAVARSMRDRGIEGSIVNVASVSGLVEAHNLSMYGAAKAGVVSLTNTMAVEWGEYGIRVNAVAMSGTRSPATLKAFGEEAFAAAAGWSPLGKSPHASDVAGAVLFLATNLSNAITGRVLIVDGGATVRRPQAGVDLPGD
jgi:NAD(P)-dependent dehydrogenase (short-subunit alcohol dehydrogenase family)